MDVKWVGQNLRRLPGRFSGIFFFGSILFALWGLVYGTLFESEVRATEAETIEVVCARVHKPIGTYLHHEDLYLDSKEKEHVPFNAATRIDDVVGRRIEFQTEKNWVLDFFTTGHTKEEVEKYLDQYSPFLPGKDEKERESLVKEMLKGGGLTIDAIQAKLGAQPAKNKSRPLFYRISPLVFNKSENCYECAEVVFFFDENGSLRNHNISKSIFPKVIFEDQQ